MQLAIDTASEIASVGLSSEGELVAEITWRCRRNHTVELLPTIDRLLEQAKCEMGDLKAVFVSTGPGMYTGLRVGISVAKGLAYALRLPLVGIGRLEAEAYAHAAFPGAVVAVHRAGRGELAWATYRGRPWREESAPRLSKPEDLVAELAAPALLVGEMDDAFRDLVRETGADIAIAGRAASVRRAAALCELGSARLSAGETAEPALVVPIYLRPPAIGPQGSAGG